MAGPTLSNILDSSAPQSYGHLSGPLNPSVSGYQSLPATQGDLPSQPLPLGHPQSHPQPQPTQTPSTPSDRGHTGTSLYACGDCGRRYSRPEHLQRHVQTHTLGRRFSCQICGKSFARADLKKRHEANHDNDTAQKRRRTASSPGVGRVAHACRACAAARVKCQEDKPCQRCIRRGLTCASSEAGSAAAMHLMHLSASAHSTSGSPPDGLEDSSPAEAYSAPAVLGGSVPVSIQTGSNQGYPSSTPAIKTDDGQLLTPDTVMEHGNADHDPSALDPNSHMGGMDRLPFSDFLRDVLFEQPFDPARLAEGQGEGGLAVLDFCNDSNLDLTDIDFSLMDHWNGDSVPADGMLVQQDVLPADKTVDIAQMRQSLVKVWTESPWRWDPNANDTGYREQGNLPVPTVDANSIQLQQRRTGLVQLVQEKLEPSARDRVLGMVLGSCRQNSTASKVASSFPSVDALDTLIHIFLNSHACQVSEWIHFPTLKLNDQWPEWLAVVAAGGAVQTPFQTLRKFGFALQEAVRITIPSRFEENNTKIQNLGLVQSLILGQDIGLWSGNRRKMEIAECHLVIPVTMMRYRRRFQRASYPLISVDISDDGPALEEKWRRWTEMEQWKRLVFHCYIRDAQASMTTLTNFAISYAELTLPLPEARELWFAKSAVEWKALYLERNGGQVKRAPSVQDLFNDFNLILANRHLLDMQLAASIFLHGYWALILEYRQLVSVYRVGSHSSDSQRKHNSVLESRHEELVEELQKFQFRSAAWPDISAQEHLVANLLLMNLHVSLDDLQLFAGKEGEDEARRVYPALQEWVEGSEARLALWSAGQVIRWAKAFPPGHLKDFYAVGVHHASLAFWANGVVTRASRRLPMPIQYESVHLDGTDAMSLRRMLDSKQVRLLIHGPVVRDGTYEASVEDPKACMEVAQDVLMANFAGGQEGLPPIVENLCVLIRQLGNAAWAVGLG
ncbi:hypothetical protein G7046_g7211 [Stylonectria norvegica]|nr:hypothetical protein G7046_g7211 [Stylonectria norvegica]